MKCIVSTACVVLSVLVAVSLAAPLQTDDFSASASLQVGGGGGGVSASTAISSGTTPATGGGGGGGGGLGGLTNILSGIDIPGLLRGVNSFVKLVGVFCPPLSQVLDNVIQNVTSTAFRVFGRLILQGGGLGGGSGGGGGGGGRVNVVLPTFPPDEDDYDDDEEDTEKPDADVGDLRSAGPASSVTPSTPSDSVSPTSEDNAISKRHVRVAREAEAEEEEDQDEAESAPEPAEDLSNVDADDADRNKRFLPFGGTADAHGGSTGGSGNFLFDIIRLVAGSGATEESDEKAHAPGGIAELDIGKSTDGYTEGIPGPITRLFVIANRGLANLVQDLILRLAQTSERLVNFKARLVTALI